MLNLKKSKIAYFQGRPHGHPAHSKYAESVGADFYFVDYKIRYHDLNSGPIRRYSSWLISALFFPKKKYDVFFTQEPYFMVGLMRWLGLIRSDQKLISLMDTHTLYFLLNDRYSKSTFEANKKLYSIYDAFICVGEFQKKLLYQFLGDDYKGPVFTVFNGVNNKRFDLLKPIKPNLESNNIIFIGAIPSEGRVWYKGIDLMLESFGIIKKHLPDLTLTIIGEYNAALKNNLVEKYCSGFSDSVIFTGNVDNIEEY